MKRLLSMMIVMALICTALAGCSNQPAQTAKETTTIKYWVGYNSDVLGAQIEKFNQTNTDGIRVELTQQTGGKYNELINIAFSSGESPDVFFANPTLIAQSVDNGYAEPLEPYMTDEVKDELVMDYVMSKNIGVFRGKLYAIPAHMTARKLIYNKDIFRQAGLDPEQPPKTLEEFAQYARKITEWGDGKVYGFPLSLGQAGVTSLNYLEIPVAYSTGINRGFNYDKGEYDFSVYADTVELYRQLRKDNVIFPGATTLKNEQESAHFSMGNIGMLMTATAWVERFISEDSEIKCDFEIGIADIPAAFSGEATGKLPVSAGGGYVMSADSKNKEAAFKFIQYMVSEKNSAEMSARGAELHWTNKNVYFNEKYYPTDELGKKLMISQDYALYPQLPYGIEVTTDAYEKVIANLILSDDDINAALDAVTKSYNEGFKAACDKQLLDFSDFHIPGFNAQDYMFKPQN